jgi:hypothetical protein
LIAPSSARLSPRSRSFVPVHGCLPLFALVWVACPRLCSCVGTSALPLAGPLVRALLFVCIQVPNICKN